MARRFKGLTDKGIVRLVNQDAFYVDPDGRFFIVADGMGGHAGGQEASHIATETIKTYLDENWDATITTPELIEKALWEANQDILDDQETHPERADMGTTVVVLVFREDVPWCAHIGDSRFYRLRQQELEQITEDQTWVARAMKMGDLSPDDARNHPWRHVLSQCLGRRDLKHLDIQQVDIQPGDRCLLCSDGLTEEVPDAEILAHLGSGEDCEAAAIALVNAAKTNGGSDNITVVILAEA